MTLVPTHSPRKTEFLKTPPKKLRGRHADDGVGLCDQDNFHRQKCTNQQSLPFDEEVA